MAQGRHNGLFLAAFRIALRPAGLWTSGMSAGRGWQGSYRCLQQLGATLTTALCGACLCLRGTGSSGLRGLCLLCWTVVRWQVLETCQLYPAAGTPEVLGGPACFLTPCTAFWMILLTHVISSV